MNISQYTLDDQVTVIDARFAKFIMSPTDTYHWSRETVWAAPVYGFEGRVVLYLRKGSMTTVLVTVNGDNELLWYAGQTWSTTQKGIAHHLKGFSRFNNLSDADCAQWVIELFVATPCV